MLESADGAVVPNQFVVGWAKRGPSGLIGTNSPDSKATVAKMIEDLPQIAASALPADDEQRIVGLLEARGVDFVTYADWQTLDAMEQELGRRDGRVRLKFTEREAMLTALRQDAGK